MLPEFLEALCRAIDKASPIPLDENKDDWPLEKRQAQPLINKLENILPLLIKLIKGPEFKNLKEKVPMPLKDLMTGLYVPNYDNPFYLGYVIKPGVKKGNMRGRASISINPGDPLTKRRSTRLISNDIIKNKEMVNNDNVNNISNNINKVDEKPKESIEQNNNINNNNTIANDKGEIVENKKE